MGLHFGELPTRVRGIITYSLSPLEQRAFAGAVGNGIPNLFRRFRSQALRVVPPIALCYLIYDWGEKEHAKLERKDVSAFTKEN